MKLIFAIVNDDDAARVLSVLNRAGFSATKLATTGRYLKSGNTTFITGVNDDQVDNVVKLISEHSKRHSQYVPTTVYPTLDAGANSAGTAKVQTGGATIFVLNVESFLQV